MRVPRLILLNGPPAAGESTPWAGHPLILCLDIDAVRRTRGGWMSQPTEAVAITKRTVEFIRTVR